MTTLKNFVLFFTLSLFVAISGCNKDDNTTPTTTNPDPNVQANSMLKNYQDASVSDTRLVNYHQHALNTGNHDSCFIYWHQFNQYDSLFSFHYYEYCRTIYANNGGQNYGHNGWNWENEHSGWNHDNWQCGLDTLQFQNWNGSGDYMNHDSQMYSLMQGYNMTGYFSSQAVQCYSNMQALRNDHHQYHNYHW